MFFLDLRLTQWRCEAVGVSGAIQRPAGMKDPKVGGVDF
jgi:hypothetical protein